MQLCEQLLAWLDRLRGPAQSVKGNRALQVGKGGGDVYVFHDRSHPAAEPPSEPPRLAPEFPQLVHVYKRELTPAEREGTDKFMRREFGTTTIRDLSDGDQVRLWAYMQTCLRNRERRRAP